MRTLVRPATICADCTAKYATLTPWHEGGCDHSSDSDFRPLTRADVDVPAESLDRSPRVSVVELAQLFVEGRYLYRELTALQDPWSLSEDQFTYALRRTVKPWDGVTFKRSGGTADVMTDGYGTRCAHGDYAVAIRPRGASQVSIPLGDPVALERVTREFTARAPFIGVFRDEVARRIDVDPVAIVRSRRAADALGVYCGSTGGAYRYSDGLGYWAPVL
jgi:hypothetical protein